MVFFIDFSSYDSGKLFSLQNLKGDDSCQIRNDIGILLGSDIKASAKYYLNTFALAFFNF